MTDLEEIKQILLNGNASLVVKYSNGVIKEYYNRRVIDIVSILKADKNALKGASIADKVIGKTAASILIVAGVKEIYANVISEHAIAALELKNIKYEYNNKVKYIINNKSTGMCPMENKFKDENDLQKIYNYFLN